MTDHDELLAEVDGWLEDTPPLVQAGTVRMVERLAAALAARPQPLWQGKTRFLGARIDPVPDRSWFVGGFALAVPPDTLVAVVAAAESATPTGDDDE